MVSEKKGITSYVKTDKFDVELLNRQSKSVVVNKIEVANTLNVIPLTDDLLNRLNSYKSSLIEGLGEAEEYKNLRNEFPAMHESLLEKYNEGTIVGVSLKKAEKSASLKITNLQRPDAVEYEGIAISPKNAKGFITFSDGGSMEFRNFGGDTGFMGELEGTGAAAGKVGYGYIKSVLDKYNVEVSDPKTIRIQASEEDPKFKTKFKKLWDETEGLDPNDFESNYNARPTPKSNQAWRISKYLALELINAIDKSENKDQITDAFVRYASSQGDESSIFVKAS